MDKITINVDASSLSASACVLHWYRVVVKGYREKVSGVSLVYGSAVHKYVDMMYKTKGHIPQSRNAAFEVFRRDKHVGKTNGHLAVENHLLVTCFNLWEEFILKDKQFQLLELPNGEPASEITFSLPYYEDDNVIIRLCGTMDGIGKIHNGVYCIRDFKTTSQYNVPSFLKAFKLSKQLLFYKLALRIMSEREPDSVLGKIGATNVGARIDGVFLKAKASDNIYQSSEVFMSSKDDLDEFQRMLDGYLHKLAFAVANNQFPREGIINGSCHAEYDCKFCNVCAAPSEVRQIMLDRDFKAVTYEPLKFGETL